ncbi:hypothetical protein GEMRC1_009230 [Eukaryota sp. GEM-RC1]
MTGFRDLNSPRAVEEIKCLHLLFPNHPLHEITAEYQASDSFAEAHNTLLEDCPTTCDICSVYIKEGTDHSCGPETVDSDKVQAYMQGREPPIPSAEPEPSSTLDTSLSSTKTSESLPEKTNQLDVNIHVSPSSVVQPNPFISVTQSFNDDSQPPPQSHTIDSTGIPYSLDSEEEDEQDSQQSTDSDSSSSEQPNEPHNSPLTANVVRIPESYESSNDHENNKNTDHVIIQKPPVNEEEFSKELISFGEQNQSRLLLLHEFLNELLHTLYHLISTQCQSSNYISIDSTEFSLRKFCSLPNTTPESVYLVDLYSLMVVRNILLSYCERFSFQENLGQNVYRSLLAFTHFLSRRIHAEVQVGDLLSVEAGIYLLTGTSTSAHILQAMGHQVIPETSSDDVIFLKE